MAVRGWVLGEKKKKEEENTTGGVYLINLRDRPCQNKEDSFWEFR